jgi:SAM-dependent methyltransferase
MLGPAADRKGSVDIVWLDEIDGWAFDPASKEPCELTAFYRGEKYMSLVADRHRDDLERRGIGSGKHAFSLPLPCPPEDFEPRFLKIEFADGVPLARGEGFLKWRHPLRGNRAPEPAEAPAAAPPVATIDRLYALMAASRMNAWVGLGNPKAVAEANIAAILAHTNLTRGDKVLDFGCGIGRTTVPLAEYCNAGEVVGIDIMYEPIQFCEDNIRPALPNTRFHHLPAANPHYDDRVLPPADRTPPLKSETLESIAEHYASYFDVVTNLSVFTHFTPEMAERYLKFFFGITKPSAAVFLTCFFDMPWNPADRRLRPEDYGFRDCVPNVPLVFALFGMDRLAAIAARTGWRIAKAVFGFRDVHLTPRLQPGAHGHDVLVLCKRPVLPADFDGARYLSANPDLAKYQGDPAEHYLRSGYFHGRPYR